MQRRSTRSMKKSSPVQELDVPKPVRRSRATSKSNLKISDSESSDSDQDFVKKKVQTPKKQKRKITDSSSSESDIENYLKSASEIDLNSSFFHTQKSKDDIPSFDTIENKILSDVKVTRLSDSDTSDDEQTEYKSDKKKLDIPELQINNQSMDKENEISTLLNDGAEIARLNFQRLQDYTKQMEEAKKSVEQYQAKQLKEIEVEQEKSEEKINIEDLLAIGEAKRSKDESDKEHSAASSVLGIGEESFSDSEQEDWEEINENETNEEESLIPKKELEITVEMPSNMKKKKGNDLLAAVKRRLNRVRKENQLLIHKVHLLCWIAHGNYVNNILSSPSMLALSLSLMPSEKSFPSKRVDLDYLEQILKWYKKTIVLSEKNTSTNLSLEELLTEQIAKKEAYSKGTLAMIFIAILRSLGIQCRLVFSLQVEPLRPPASDLHFLGDPSSSKEKKKKIEKVKTEKHGDNTEKKSDIIRNVKEKPSVKKKDSEKKKTDKRESLGDKSTSTKKKQQVETKKEISSEDKSKVKGEKETSKYFKESEKKENDRKGDKKGNEDRTNKSETKKGESKEKVEKKSQESNERKSMCSSRQSLVKEVKEMTKEPDKSKPNSKKKGSKDSKEEIMEAKRATRSKLKSPTVESQPVRSKSASILKVRLERIDEVHGKLRSKSSSSPTKKGKSKKIPQLDGLDDSAEFKGFKESPKKIKTANGSAFENFYTQIYKQVSKGPSTSKVNLKKLKSTSSSADDDDCKSMRHRRSVKRASYVEKDSTDSEDDFEDSSPRKKIKSEKPVRQDSGRRSGVDLTKLKNSKSTDKKEGKETPKKTIDVTQDIMDLIKGRIKEQKHIDKKKLVKKKKTTQDFDSDDSDYVPEAIDKKHRDSDDEFYPQIKAKKTSQPRNVVKKIKKKKAKDTNSRKVISSDSEYTEEEEVVVKKEDPVKKKRGNDTWLEVFLDMEEKWISVDVVRGQAHCVNELFSRASHPVSYILAWDNESHIKDITRRYCQNFNTVTRKLRIDAKWWEESLKPFVGPKNARDREEDDELDRMQQEKPLPTTISEYKNHPLYALERHLLKFEAIYPPNAVPLGYVRNEPVYSRDCIFVCHSRDIWLKQAKVVKRKEKPYKIVKARPKYDRLSNTFITDQLLEIFGPWQVEDYDPPTAENGIVPRNAFGNVDLFKPSMLPKKCVHLRLPGLNKTAKRLNIDCASAIVGFDFHGGWSHPLYDGFVVCEEYEDELVAAWNMEQEEQEKKEQEKYEKRVYGNWKKLIRGLMIRERLKAKYGFGKNEEEEDSEGSSEPKEKKPKMVIKKNRRLISDSSEDENQ